MGLADFLPKIGIGYKNTKTPSANGIDLQAKTITGAKNKASGSNLTEKQQRGLRMYNDMAPEKLSPKEYLKLPESERKQYESLVGSHHDSQGSSQGQQLAGALGDTFSCSREAQEDQHEGEGRAGGILSALAGSFA